MMMTFVYILALLGWIQCCKPLSRALVSVFHYSYAWTRRWVFGKRVKVVFLKKEEK